MRTSTPFAAAGGSPFRDYQPYLGGVVRLLSNFSANTDVTIEHTLRNIPHGMLILNTQPGFLTPKWTPSTVTPWSTSTITVQFDTAFGAGDVLVVLVLT